MDTLEVEARLETTRREFDETVKWHQRCQECDEQRMSYLTWDEDGEVVTCATCGNRYTL